MKKQFTTQRKWSAIVALTLAVVVTFMAALQSYGVTKVEELIVYDIKGSLDRAYEEALESDKLFDIEVPSAQLQTIKIFDADDNLVLSVVMEKDGVVEDEKAKKMLNRAEFLASYSNTSIYKLID
ncbi:MULTISPECIES: hypothetical protein [Roseivirga]|nr:MULTISPECIES: hypothetical protein [Roseivirga]MEC7756060.1 hypothetical protein [Bacteroidota bacterium]|tara:strand:- start:472 stop:846 length:375 start_codon:yes stop_codon:yes gene_type:complete